MEAIRCTKCPPNSVDPYLHLIKHSKYIPDQQLVGARINTSLISLASGLHTPHVTEKRMWKLYSSPRLAKTLTGLRWAIWRERQFAYAIYNKDFFVPPWAGGEGVKKAFALREPPSPYEVACALLKEPSNNFWKVTAHAPHMRHAQSIMYWWLMGMPVEAIATVLSTKRIRRGSAWRPQHSPGCGAVASVEGALASFIRHMMSLPRFALWALGSNLLPACSNRHMARMSVILLRGEKLPKETAQRHQLEVAFKKLFDHPYVQGQFKTGKRSNPVARPLYTPGVVWETAEEKQEWEQSSSPGAKSVLGKRVELLKYKKQHPSWLQLPLY